MLARRLPAPARHRAPRHEPSHHRPRPAGAWRRRGRQPSIGPAGEVRWWERSAPDGDEARWRAVQRCHEALRARGWTVVRLARRLAADGHAVRRETLSRILNGRQGTTWETVEAMADALGVDLDDVR